MRDFTKKQLESGRPSVEPKEAIEYCLKALYDDKEHSIKDYAAADLTYEEIIGALLLAHDRFSLDEKEQ